jgi:hypothetical protein
MHTLDTITIPRQAARSAALALALAWFAWATPARAELILGITTNSFTPGSATNSLDVTLTNTGNTDMTIAGFSFEITAASSDVTFSDVTVDTVSVFYIFGTNSSFAPDITLDSNNDQTISGADNFTTAKEGSVLAAGQTLGLGNVLFALSSSTPMTPIDITFTLFPFTGVNDQYGAALPFDLASNLDISPAIVVPEPPMIVLLVSGLLVGTGFHLRRLGIAKLRTWLRDH